MTHAGLALGIAAVVLAAALAITLVPWLWSRARAPSMRVTLERRGSAPGPARPDVLRVVTYNIAHLRGLPEDNWRPSLAERDARATEIARLLVELDADVVVLNEVDFDASWSGRVDAAALLAERAGYPFVVRQRNLDTCVAHLCWRFGNAILSRVELDEPSALELPDFAGWESALAGKKRGALVRLKLPGGDVRLAAVHLCHRSEAVRLESARMLTSLAAEDTTPLIVAGDLNAAPGGFPRAQRTASGDTAFALLDLTFTRVPDGARPTPDALTFPSIAPDRVLDWILVHRLPRPVGYRVVHSPLSDHLPVVADLPLR